MSAVMRVFSRPAFGSPAPSSAADVVPRFVAGSPVATPEGPRPVETLAPGDRVATREGARVVAEVALRSVPREDWTYRRQIWPVRVPVGSLGNPVPLRLVPEQRVRLCGDAFAASMGVDEIWVPVAALVGLRGLAVERPLGALRRHGLRLEGDAPAAIEVAGAWCALEDEGEAFDRDRVRAAFQAMNAAGEPRLG